VEAESAAERGATRTRIVVGTEPFRELCARWRIDAQQVYEMGVSFDSAGMARLKLEMFMTPHMFHDFLEVMSHADTG
jgi:hypothetical protein